jgi:hypothetical protein
LSLQALQDLSGAELLAELRRLRLLAPASESLRPVHRAPSGLPALDSACGGGFPRGQISELVFPARSGSGVVYAALAAAGAREESAALVDPGDGFDPTSAVAAGVVLERLLWVRSRDAREALRGAELILQVGGFGVLILDLRLPRGRPLQPPRAAWLRLGRRARESGTVLLVLSEPESQVGSFAALAVQVRRLGARWRGRGERWLAGVECGFAPLRRRGG